MSSVVIYGDTSGAITLAANAVAGTNTITLPARTGTMLTTATPGTVLQVVSFTNTTATTTTSVISSSGGTINSTGASTGLTLSITPTSASSKILVSGTVGGANGYPAAAQCLFLLLRNSTLIGNGVGSGARPGIIGRAYYNDTNTAVPFAFSYLDSPATTSATTYTLNFGTDNGSYSVYFNRTPSANDTIINPLFSSTITLMEIAA